MLNFNRYFSGCVEDLDCLSGNLMQNINITYAICRNCQPFLGWTNKKKLSFAAVFN